MSDRVYDLAKHPFTVIENALLECKNLNIYEKMVFILLKKCGSKSGTIYPGVETIAAWMGCSKRQVQKCMASLEARGLVKRITRKNRSNIYILHDFSYDGTSIKPRTGSAKTGICKKPQDMGGEPHSPQGEGRGEPGSPGGACHSPRGERGSPIKVLLKKNHLKESSSSGHGKERGDDMTTNLADEWKEVFGRNIPRTASPEMMKAADYMLYLRNNGELTDITRPVAYLKGMVRHGFPESGWPSYLERVKKRELLAMKEKERRRKEKEGREEMFRLREKWDALPEPEKRKWALEAEKRDDFRILSGSMRPYMAWMTSQEIHNTNK